MHFTAKGNDALVILIHVQDTPTEIRIDSHGHLGGRGIRSRRIVSLEEEK